MSVDSLGFRPDRFPEIVNTIEGFQRANISKPFSYTDDKVIYQINTIFASRIDSLSKAVEEVVANWRLSEASGVWLDGLSLLRGVPRIQASSSFTSSQYLFIKPGGVLPAGSQFRSSISTRRAYNLQEVRADNLNSFDTTCSISSAAENLPDGSEFRITINGVDYVTTKTSGNTAEDILNKLVLLFQADTTKEWTFSTGTSDNGGAELNILPPAERTVSVITYSTLFTIDLLKVYLTVYLTETGAINIPTMSMDGLVNPLPLIASTNNDLAFIPGNAREEDESLRFRIAQGPVSDATGTVLAIESKVLTNVTGVTLTKVIENTGDVPLLSANGRFGGIETLVVGGTNEAVAEELFRNKGAGVPTFGNTTVVIVDDEGTSRTVKFSRPVAINVAVRVTYNLYDEETLPNDAVIAIRQALTSSVTTQGLDQDLIPTRLIGDVYKAVPEGLGTVTVEAQVIPSSGDTPNSNNWSISRIPADISEFITTNLVDVTTLQV